MNTIWTDFVSFWENDVWAGLKLLFQNTVSAEVAALTPIVQSVVATVETDLKGATSLSQIASSVATVFTSVASQAEAAAISAGASSLITTVSSVLAGVLPSTSSAATPVTPASPPAAS